MARDNGLFMGAVAFAFSLIAAVSSFGPVQAEGVRKKDESGSDGSMKVGNRYVGVWVTGDGHIRHELLPNGRYVEARGAVEKAYEGQYTINGSHIDYRDDTGFTADGDFKDGILYHAGMVLYRRSEV